MEKLYSKQADWLVDLIDGVISKMWWRLKPLSASEVQLLGTARDRFTILGEFFMQIVGSFSLKWTANIWNDSKWLTWMTQSGQKYAPGSLS